MSSNVLT